MSRTVYAGALLVVALVLGGCAETVSGNGAPGSGPLGPPTASSGAPSSDTQSGASSTPPPSPSGSEHASTSAEPPASNLACPQVVDPASHLAYTCIAPGMKIGAPTSMWPVRFEKDVDVQWTMDEGSGPVDAPGSDVTSVARVLSTTMARSNYGPSPRATVQRDVDVSVSGKKAHLVETLMTIDPAYRKGRGLKVASERLWIVAVQVAADQITAWYVSVPDVQKALWPKVPDLIEQLKVV